MLQTVSSLSGRRRRYTPQNPTLRRKRPTPSQKLVQVLHRLPARWAEGRVSLLPPPIPKLRPQGREVELVNPSRLPK